MSPISPFLAPERDSTLKLGRAKGAGTTHYCIPGIQMVSAPSLHTMVLNTDYYGVVSVQSPILVDALVFEVTTLAAASNARCGLYPADTDFQPAANAAPLADSGDISVATTGVKIYTPTSPIYLPRGRYLTVINSSGGPIVRAHSGGTIIDSANTANSANRYSAARTYAAFPTPGTAWTTYSSSGAQITSIVWFRVISP